ncbi:unnamed protein product [Blumeria hordei]|uniref:Fibroin-3 related protein n=2 Tax=Blumeria hordei TaxID=2867405 RepID=A0A383UTI5_BLUHO|nr:unnamed protein product [Blumeria hordei]
MTYINAAMQRSLRRDTVGILSNVLGPRLITEQVASVKSTFSSWDNCMTQVYCKWPVIVGVLIAGLILLSIITCIARCLCCGYSCCCACFSFLKCCSCCGGCCDGKRSKSMRYADEPAYNSQGYKAPAPMMAVANISPQYAQFPTASSGQAAGRGGVNEDALPAMPSWDSASKVHVPDDAEDNNNGEVGAQQNSSAGQKTSLVAAAAPIDVSSPGYQRERDAAPFAPRPSPSTPGGIVNRQTYGVPTRQYDGSPGPDNGFRGSGMGYGGLPAPSNRGFMPPALLASDQARQPSPIGYRNTPNGMGSPALDGYGYSNRDLQGRQGSIASQQGPIYAEHRQGSPHPSQYGASNGYANNGLQSRGQMQGANPAGYPADRGYQPYSANR